MKLKELRARTGKTQTETAKELGLSRQTYSHYENELREPDIQTLIRMAKYFNVSVDELLEHQTPQSPYISIDILELAKKIKNLPPNAQKLVEEQVRLFVDMNDSSDIKR